MTSRRILLMGPVSVHSLAGFLPADIQPSLPRGAGGAALVNLILTRLYADLPTDVITLDASVPPDGIFLEHGSLRLWIGPRRARHAMRDLFAQERRTIHGMIQQSAAEVCHAHWTHEYGLAAVTQSRMPTVVTVHDRSLTMLLWTGPRYLPLFWMSRRVLRAATHLTAVSPRTASDARRIARRPVAVVPNCLAHETMSAPFVRRIRQTDAPRIAGAWSWANYRNTRRGLKVFADVRKRYPGATLHLMGVDMETNGLAHRWAQAHGIENGVEFLGLPAWTEALAILTQSDLVFHPSLEESFSLPVAEALARGIPVVAARQSSGPAWLVEQSGSGRLVDGRDEKAMTRAVLDSLDAAAPETQGSCAERIRKILDPGRVLHEYETIYEHAKNPISH